MKTYSLSGIRYFCSSWKYYKIAFNLVSLILALFFSTIFLSVIFLPTFSKDAEHFIVTQYVEYYQDKERQVLQAGNQGNTELFAQLLSKGFSEIQKGDRIYPRKRQLLMHLCADLYAEQNYPELLHWATIWFHLDERDVTALAYYYQALWFVEHRQEALDELIQAQLRFPKHALLQQFGQGIPDE